MVRQDGVFVGSVSGGCVEGAVVQQALEMLAEEKNGQRLSFGVSTEDAWSVGLSCGGEISIWVERTEQSVLQELISALHSRMLVGLSLPMNDKGMLIVNAWETEPTF